MFAAALWAQAPSQPAAPAKPAAVKPAPAKPASAQPAVAQPAAAKPVAMPAKAAQTPADPVVFTAGGTQMTRSEFDSMMRSLPENVRAQFGGDSPEARRRVAEQIGEILTFANEAKKLKMDEKPAVRVQLYLQREGALANLFAQHLTETNKPAGEQAEAWYAAHQRDYETATARHILIRFQGSRVPLKPDQKDLTDAEALARTQALRERLVKGEDFAALAKAESDDTGSGAQGGDLGSFGHGRMVPVFEDAAFSLPIGELSQPVKSPFGYHLIQVQARSVDPLEKVKPEIEKKLQSEAAQKAMEAVKAAHRPALEESYFGKAPASPAPAR